MQSVFRFFKLYSVFFLFFSLIIFPGLYVHKPIFFRYVLFVLFALLVYLRDSALTADIVEAINNSPQELSRGYVLPQHRASDDYLKTPFKK